MSPSVQSVFSFFQGGIFPKWFSKEPDPGSHFGNSSDAHFGSSRNHAPAKTTILRRTISEEPLWSTKYHTGILAVRPIEAFLMENDYHGTLPKTLSIHRYVMNLVRTRHQLRGSFLKAVFVLFKYI